MFRKRTFLFPEPVKKSKESGSGRFGEEGVLQIPEQGYLLTSADLCKAVSKEEFYRFLGKDGIGEKDAALQELGRRARVRNRSGSYAAVWIGR